MNQRLSYIVCSWHHSYFLDDDWLIEYYLLLNVKQYFGSIQEENNISSI